MLLSTIREAVTDRLTTETIEQPRLDRFIASTVCEYSRYNPLITGLTMSSVVDQAVYDLPDACLWVLECYWWPIGQLFAELRAGAEQIHVARHPARYHMPSDRIIDNINQSAHIDAILGQWEQRNDTLVIHPEPTATGSEDIDIVYAAYHEINEAELGYDTIPDEDLDIIADVALALYLRARAAETALEPDYAEGLQRVTKRFMPANLRDMVRELRKGLTGKYGGQGGVVVR